MIPYPLSTGPECGDPMYSNFECNTSTRQVLFKVAGCSYRVTRIDPEILTFVLQMRVTDMKDVNCSSPSFIHQIRGLKPPFHSSWNASNVSKTDSFASNMALENSIEVEISWDPTQSRSVRHQKIARIGLIQAAPPVKIKGEGAFAVKNSDGMGRV